MRVLGAAILILLSRVSLLEAFEVPVIVREPGGIARKAEPVSGGIALPAGMFKPGTVKLALFDGDRPVPVSELVVGPRGFVRWVLLDFQLDLQTNETKTLTLKAGQPTVPQRPLKITETINAVFVDTGRISFMVSKGQSMFGVIKSHISQELKQIKDNGLYKAERIITSPQNATITVQSGQKVLNLCANNYLGLTDHPEIIRAAQDSYRK